MIWMHSSVAPRLGVALLLTAAFLRAGPSRFVPILRLGTGAQHLRRRFLRAAHWIILAVIVITGVAQSALARVLDPWIVTTLRVGFRLLSLALIVHVFGLMWSGWQASLVDKRVRLRFGVLICAVTCAVDRRLFVVGWLQEKEKTTKQ